MLSAFGFSIRKDKLFVLNSPIIESYFSFSAFRLLIVV